MKLSSLYANLVLASEVPYQADKDEFCVVKGISMVSTDAKISVSEQATADKCWEECVACETCKNWTWVASQDIDFLNYHRPARCYLIKSEKPPVISVDELAVSGAMLCRDEKGKMHDCLMVGANLSGSDRIKEHINGKTEDFLIPGNSQSAIYTSTAEQCQELCHLISDCILFTWCTFSTECRIQNSGAEAYADLGKVSGTNFC